MKPGSTLRVALILALAIAVPACGGRDDPAVETLPGADAASQAVRVTDLQLGPAIGPDRRVIREAEAFRPTETVYASVVTEGTGPATLTARWTYQDGQVVDDTSQTITPAGQAVTEFHISMPGGLPVGRYQVEILLNGQAVETEAFQVR